MNAVNFLKWAKLLFLSALILLIVLLTAVLLDLMPLKYFGIIVPPYLSIIALVHAKLRKKAVGKLPKGFVLKVRSEEVQIKNTEMFYSTPFKNWIINVGIVPTMIGRNYLTGLSFAVKDPTGLRPPTNCELAVNKSTADPHGILTYEGGRKNSYAKTWAF